MSSEIPETEKKNKETALGRRLMQAFFNKYGTQDKRFIADELGFKSEKAVYKVLNGEQEMKFSTLLQFRESTEHSIDWLLSNDFPKHIEKSDILLELIEDAETKDKLEKFWDGAKHSIRLTKWQYFESIIQIGIEDLLKENREEKSAYDPSVWLSGVAIELEKALQKMLNNSIRESLKEIVREEMQSQNRGTMTLPINVGNKKDSEEKTG